MKSLQILIGCEESQAVCIEFRKLGHEAFSCDLQLCSGGHPEWHIQGDVIEAINSREWDMGIFFPPCFDLAVSGAAHFAKKRESGQQQKSIDFFLQIANAPIPRKAIENPIGIMSSIYRVPDQIVNPYYFGDPVRKPTCLWLTNLPKLVWNQQNNLFEQQTAVAPEIVTMTSKKTGRTRSYSKWEYEASCNKDRKTIRSKTFPGLAAAMAQQWGK